MSVNKAILIGNLGRDPELRHTTAGQPVCEFSLATNEKWRDSQGQQHERTEWHRIIVWGKQGENAARFLTKGRQVYVEGRIQSREWEDKDGNKRTTTEIVAHSVQFLSGGDSGGGGSQRREHSAPSSDGNPFTDDHIPF